MLRAWLLQHYALAVWASTGVDLRRRPPAPLEKLLPFIRAVITGQVLAVCVSLYFALGGRALPDWTLVVGIGLVVAWMLVWALPLLDTRLKKECIPAAFRQLAEPQRRRQAWTGMLLFWAAFFSIFFVAAFLS